MTKYNESPFHWLNDYLENRLRGIDESGGTANLSKAVIPQADKYVTSLATSTSDFSLPFLSPGGQQSEVMNIYSKSSKTYSQIPIATYSVMVERPYEPWSYGGKMTYILYSGNADTLFEIGEYARDLFGRKDWSAYDINYFFRNNEDYPFDFKYVCLDSIAGPFPAREEGGLLSSMLVVDYEATYEGPNRVDDWDDNDYGLGMRI